MTVCTAKWLVFGFYLVALHARALYAVTMCLFILFFSLVHYDKLKQMSPSSSSLSWMTAQVFLIFLQQRSRWNSHGPTVKNGTSYMWISKMCIFRLMSCCILEIVQARDIVNAESYNRKSCASCVNVTKWSLEVIWGLCLQITTSVTQEVNCSDLVLHELLILLPHFNGRTVQRWIPSHAGYSGRLISSHMWSVDWAALFPMT